MATDFGSFFYPPAGSGGGGGGGAPTGPAGGDLGGSYPDPTVPLLHNTANTFAGFDDSGDLSQIQGTSFNDFGEVALFGTGTVDGNNFTGLQLENNISDPLTGGYEGIIVSPTLSSTMTFQSAYNVEIDYTASYRNTGGIGQYQDQSHMEDTSQSSGYTSFSAIPIIDGQLNGGGTSFVAGAAYSHAATGGITAYNDFIHLTSTAITTFYQSAQCNPILDAGSIVQNFIGFNSSPTLNGTISGNFQGVQINPQGTGAIASATGLTIQLGNITTADPQGPTAINTDSRVSINADTNLTSSLGFQIGNRVESLLGVVSGSPVTGTDSIGNDFAGDLNAQDSLANGPTGGIVGWTGVGFISELVVAAGKTVDTANIFLAGAALPTPINPGDTDGGTVTNLSMVKTFPPLNEGGALTITNLKALNVAGSFSGASTNVWGLFVEDTALGNYIGGNLAIGTTTTKVSNGSVGLELGSTTQALRLSNLTAAQETALTPLSGMILFNADTSVPDYYNGTAWVPISGGGGGGANTALSNLITTAINTDLLADSDGARSIGAPSLSWANGYISQLVDDGGTTAISISSRRLLSSSGARVLSWNTGTALLAGGVNLSFLGATSGNAVSFVADTNTNAYSMIFPATQTAGALTNDGAGNLSWSSGGSGANTALSNLASVAVNADINPASDNTINMGIVGNAWKQVDSQLFQGANFLLDPGVSGTPVGQFSANQAGSDGNNYPVGVSSLLDGDGLLYSTAAPVSGGPSGVMLLGSGAVSVDASASGVVTLASGPSTTGNSGNVVVTSGTAGAASGNIILQIGAAPGTTGMVEFVDGHLVSRIVALSSPTIAVNANAGTGATASVAAGSTDTAGSFTLNAGTGVLSSGAQATVTFNKSYGSATGARVMLMPTNAAAGILTYVTKTATTFTLNFVAGGIISTTYTFDYHVIGR